MLKSILTILLVGVGLQVATAQYKFEKEDRIKAKEVPAAALAFVEECAFPKKICWYREQGYNSVSIEAKTKFRGTKYSIEFDTLGTIEDVEYKIKWQDITQEAKSAIQSYFDANHSKTNIRKIQRQLTGPDLDLQQAMLTDEYVGTVTKYEIEVKAKIDGKYMLKEYLFDSKGQMLSVSEVIFRNSDNLEF